MANEDAPAAVGSEPAASPAQPSATGLDFDKAAYVEPVGTKLCTACKQGIASEYYEVNGNVICTRCRDHVAGGKSDRWSFWRALLYGGLAAAAGTLVWSLMIYLTGYELGLIAIIVGIAVGIAVRKGSRGRGGWKYQTLAMVLTYVSITTSYVPLVVKGLVKGYQDHAPAVTSPQGSAPAANDEGAATKAAAPATPADANPSLLLGLAALLAFVALVWGLALAAPFLAGASNIMGIIIIAVGLYEAWRFNRTVKVNGPFRLAPIAPAPPPAAPAP